MSRELLLLPAALLAGVALQAPAQGQIPWSMDPAVQSITDSGRTVRAWVMLEVEAFDPDVTAQSIDVVQAALLDVIGRKGDPDVRLFETIPFLALDLDAVDVAGLLAEDDDIVVLGSTVRFRVERVPRMRAQSSRPAPGTEVLIGELLPKLGMKPTKEPAGTGWTVVVVDEGVDPAAGTLQSPISDGSAIENGPVCPVGAYPPADPSQGAPALEGAAHGTSVAAVVSWMAPGAELVSIRVGEGYGALADDVVAALQEVECRWSSSHSVAAVVVSLANPSVTQASHPATFAAMRLIVDDLARYEKIPVVVAAGNDGWIGHVSFPANVLTTVAVAGTTNSCTERAPASNWSDQVDFVAPGFQVGLPVEGSYYPEGVSGTSIAAPFVGGAFAALRTRFPTCELALLIAALSDPQKNVSATYAGGTVSLPLVQVESALAELEGTCGP